MKNLEADEKIHFPVKAGGVPRLKRYLHENKGQVLSDIWTDIPPISSHAKERLGYPTQKPLALLERIIKASSKPSDLVLDPFCGCGTTVHAAQSLRRRWIGIDISPFAVRLVRDRLLIKTDHTGSIPIHGIPVDLDGARDLLRRDPFAFEAWMVTSIPGMAPNERRSHDRGIDGKGAALPQEGFDDDRTVIAQVKGGGATASAIRDFLHVMERDKALAGIFMTLKRTTNRNARAEAAKLGMFKVRSTGYPRLQLWSAEELLQGKLPLLPPMADPYTGKEIQRDLFS